MLATPNVAAIPSWTQYLTKLSGEVTRIRQLEIINVTDIAGKSLQKRFR